ncbi:ribose-phosphate pyrophosphokinase [uncultured Acetobacterium sp.]|uniref:ribose-phosphate diphosphokinase n=1 Tax=uncultured Acetobacterium sp. TaxID=217139 RepID=UPI002428C313|nr:ribose-phosphate pyrophosphokinase [uncultured Acetobacterium sp.]MBU4541935.1 ribose-phosphate pyrophosphokinase [Bacillota bacterium]
MDGKYSGIKIIAGNSNMPLAQEIAEYLEVQLCNAEVVSFSDGELGVNVFESVRGADVFVIQSTGTPVNENLMELLILIDSMKRASAGRINAVIPYYGYARQDRKAKSRDPITAKLVANLLTTAGADRVITMDLHSNQIQGFFDIPLDHLSGSALITEYYKEKKLENMVVVSPDVGSVKRSRTLARNLNCPFAIVDKERPRPNETAVMNVIGDVKGKNCIMIDDMIDTAGTITSGANALLDLGASSVFAACSHGVFSGPAIQRIQDSAIEELVTLNTLCIPKEKRIEKIKILSTGTLFGRAIDYVHFGRSLSKLFVGRYV